METPTHTAPPVDLDRIVRLPVQANKMPFGSWMWFITDADGNNLAQIMPSTDEAQCRELVELINLGAQKRDEICEANEKSAGTDTSAPKS